MSPDAKDPQDVQARLDQLEGDVRRTRNLLGLMTLAAFAAFVTLFVWTGTHGREHVRFATIEARELVIDPRTGAPKIKLGADSSGFTRVMIGSDRGDQPGVGFGFAGGGQFVIKGKNGAAGVNLSDAQLVFFHDSTSYGAALGRGHSSGFVSLEDSIGFTRVEASGWTRFAPQQGAAATTHAPRK